MNINEFININKFICLFVVHSVLKVLKYNREQEAIIMKDVPGWVVGEHPYHNKDWMEPSLENLYFMNEEVRQFKIYGFASWV